MAKSEVIPFGKYKGQPVEVLQQDREYCEWLMAQDWFRVKFQPIWMVIVNHFGEPSETPEHNALQARFTDAEFRRKFVWHLHSAKIIRSFAARKKECQEAGTMWCEERRKDIEDERQQLAKALREMEEDDGSGPEWESRWRTEKIERLGRKIPAARQKLAETEALIQALETIPPPLLQAVDSTVQFEVGGTDVVIEYQVSGFHPRQEFESRAATGCDGTVHVECKPSLSDDYPAVLRQVTASRDFGSWSTTHVILVGDSGYTGSGATLDQVKAIFASRNVSIVFLEDIP